MGIPLILVINPGSTSTRIAIYEGERAVAEKLLECSADELAHCKTIADQVPLRAKHVADFLKTEGRKITDFAAIAARGGPIRPVPGGVYRVNKAMLDDARSEKFIEHVSKAACIIADELGRSANIPAFIVDPVSTDEYVPLSRISGLKDLPRKSMTHALNMKAAARIYARELGKRYDEINLITVQLGGGCSVAVHERGRMIDSVDANGEGPFSPERSGGLRVDDLARMICEGKCDFKAIRGTLTRKGGFVSYFGTADAREIEKRALAGDAEAKLVYEALAYNVAKHIAALSAAVAGKLDGIVLTGGLAKSEILAKWISERVKFIAPVRVLPGEREMEALAAGVARVLAKQESPKVYPTGEQEK